MAARHTTKCTSRLPFDSKRTAGCERTGVGTLRVALALLWLLGLTPSIGSAAAPEFDFQALRLLIERDRIDSIEAALAALPTDLRSHYVLVFSSRSSQHASFRYPRAILYGSDAHLMVSFNGDPAAHGYQTLETAEYDAEQARFRFREIRFASSPANSAEVKFSEVDPVRCQRCHGTPTRPVWDMSPLWPGAYGERYRANLTGAERAGLQQFLEQQPTHPRYRALVAAERFAYRGTFAPDAKDEYAGAQREPPNAEFSQLLARMNMQMIARQLREQTKFAAYQYALLGAAEGNCGSLMAFLPASQRSWAEPALRQFLKATESADALQEESKRLRAVPGTLLVRFFGAAGTPSSTLGDVRFLAETALGITTRNWTLALEKGTYDFSVPGGGNAALSNALRATVAQGDARMEELQSTREYSAEDRYCVYLRERSRSALAALPEAEAQRFAADHGPVDNSAPAPESMLQHCASCHAEGAAPPLPFDRPQLLAPLLRHRASAHGDLLGEILFRLSPEAGTKRMPRDANLEPAQREALAHYLVSLAEAPEDNLTTAPEPRLTAPAGGQ